MAAAACLAQAVFGCSDGDIFVNGSRFLGHGFICDFWEAFGAGVALLFLGEEAAPSFAGVADVHCGMASLSFGVGAALSFLGTK